MAVVESTTAGADLLVTSEDFDLGGDEAWPAVFPADPTNHEVLVVTIMGSPEQWVDRWRKYATGKPAHLGFVDAGGVRRSSGQKSGDRQPLGADLSVRTVGEPGDLTGIGIAISEYLSDWEDTGNQPLVYVDSLTPLLQYAEVEAVARFIHILTSRIQVAGGKAYIRLNPEAHDDRTVATLKSMVDGVTTPDSG